MNYYQHHIGDYRRDTAHLSLLEHGIYRQLLDQYYLDESPICADDAKLMRSLCARTADEMQAVKNVLSDFFSLAENGYVHDRCELEMKIIYSKSAKAKQSAETRWHREEGKKTSATHAIGMRSHSEGNATQYPIPNTHNKPPSSPTASKKVSAIFDYWKDLMSSPRSALDSKRKSLIEKALKNYSPEDICLAILGCSKSTYHMGDNDKVTKYNGLDLILRSADKIDSFIALSGGAGGVEKKDWV